MQDRLSLRSGGLFGLLAITAFLVVTYAYLTQSSHLGQFHYDGIYAVTGQAIANGQGHRVISVPTAPPETKYPILYSLALSLIWLQWPEFPANITLLKALNIVGLLW